MKIKKWLFAFLITTIFAFGIGMSFDTHAATIVHDKYSYAKQYKNDDTYDVENYYPTEFSNCKMDNYNLFGFIDECLLAIDYDNYENNEYEGHVDISGDFTFKDEYIYYFSSSEDDLSDIQNVYTYLETENVKMYYSLYAFFDCDYDYSFLNDHSYEFAYEYYSLYDSYFYNGLIVMPLSDFEVNIPTTLDWVAVYTKGDNIMPDVNTDTHVVVNVDDMLSYDEINTYITAYDETDGDVSDSIQLISTTYYPDNKQIGTFEYIFSVSDKSGNTRESTLYIDVVDVSNPTLSGTTSYTFEYNSEGKLTAEEIKANLIASDNYDTSLDINIISDAYTGNESVVGNYIIKYQAVDDSENSSDILTTNITIEDKTSPIITAPEIIDCSNSARLTEDEIKAKIVVEDEYEGLIIDYEIKDNDSYYSYYREAGEYSFTINACDSYGNTATHEFTLNNSDVIPPILFVARNFVIIVSHGKTLSKSLIIKHLEKIGEIDPVNVATVSFEEDVDNDGTYNCSLLMLDNTEYRIKVVSTASSSEDTTTTPEEPNTPNDSVGDGTVDDDFNEDNENNNDNQDNDKNDIMEQVEYFFTNTLIEEPVIFWSIIGGLVLIAIIGLVIIKKKR